MIVRNQWPCRRYRLSHGRRLKYPLLQEAGAVLWNDWLENISKILTVDCLFSSYS